MRATHLLVSLAIIASSALGCGATVEVPRFCLTQPGVVIPGSPVGGDFTTPPLLQVELNDQIPLLRIDSSDTDVRMDTVTITPVAGAPDLSGIQSATVRAQPASGPAVELAQYQRDPAAPAPAAIVFQGGNQNITPFLVAGQANLSFAFSGQPPRTDWTADIETCMHGEATARP